MNAEINNAPVLICLASSEEQRMVGRPYLMLGCNFVSDQPIAIHFLR